jgi:hypothetical protein
MVLTAARLGGGLGDECRRKLNAFIGSAGTAFGNDLAQRPLFALLVFFALDA